MSTRPVRFQSHVPGSRDPLLQYGLFQTWGLDAEEHIGTFSVAIIEVANGIEICLPQDMTYMDRTQEDMEEWAAEAKLDNLLQQFSLSKQPPQLPPAA